MELRAVCDDVWQKSPPHRAETYLELMFASLRRRRRVQKIDCENLVVEH